MMLHGKTCLITGSARGIGKAIALTFANAGADVIVVDRNRVENELVGEEVRSLGRKALAIEADVSKPRDVSRFVQDSLSEFGQIDVFVNNAGIWRQIPIMDISLEVWDEYMNVNLRAVFLCTREVLKHMIERNEGKIINVASGAGLRGSSTNAAYSASKAGVIAFSQAVADEVRDFGIKVNIICPRAIKTEMLTHAIKLPAVHGATALPVDPSSYMEPEEVAGAALFLASDYSGNMNAQVITVTKTNRW